jgi:hypothetical protein
MARRLNPNLEILMFAVDQLGELADKMVFVGKKITGSSLAFCLLLESKTQDLTPNTCDPKHLTISFISRVSVFKGLVFGLVGFVMLTHRKELAMVGVWLPHGFSSAGCFYGVRRGWKLYLTNVAKKATNVA